MSDTIYIGYKKLPNISAYQEAMKRLQNVQIQVYESKKLQICFAF